MLSIERCPVPDSALLRRYVDRGYVDCYRTDLAPLVTQAQFIEAFYTTAVFRLERWILAWAVSKPSTDAGVRALATGQADQFAAWTVEARAVNQLLLCDYLGRTRSWLMVEPIGVGAGSATKLYFGSAVVRSPSASQGTTKREHPLPGLAGFHKVYSRVLLATARRRLVRQEA